jgi:hypothetical protein
VDFALHAPGGAAGGLIEGEDAAGEGGEVELIAIDDGFAVDGLEFDVLIFAAVFIGEGPVMLVEASPLAGAAARRSWEERK